MSTDRPHFSLRELEELDPQSSTRSGHEQRFLCPLCGGDKPRDAAHRSFCANLGTGAWNCKRCKATGKLTDFWVERPKLSRREHSRNALKSAFTLESPKLQTEPATTSNWRAHLKALQPLQGTPSEEYLTGRGIALEAAHLAGTRFSGDFYGRCAVVFPIRDRAGALVAASGRYIDGRDNPKTRIAGAKRNGVFFAPVQLPSGRILQPFDKDAPAVIVTEAPIDALSIATAGFPAIALCGTSGAVWLYKACGFRRVLLAFDADDAGDNAAASMTSDLANYGASCERLRPENGKDWNEVLCRSSAALTELLAVCVLVDTTRTPTNNEYSIFDDQEG